jgi:2-hydroxycyclohexanecarboxyl-CoA dehydrogenase
VAADLTDPAAVAAAARLVGRDLPEVHAVINNAGITDPGRFEETSLDRWRQVFSINVDSQFLVTQAFLPGMVERGSGRVVAVASAAGQRGGGYFGGVHYSASKAAVLGMVKALAREYAGTGVTFNAVAPGAIATDITAGALSDERRRAIEAATPVGRLGTAAEVAAVIAFLCSDEAAFVTGATYDVNGGSHIH